MEQEKIFFEQAELVDIGVKLIEARITEIETKGKYPENTQEVATLHLFKTRSLKVYRDTLSYLAKEVRRTEPRVHYFLLAHVRTLVDIYARFLHLAMNCEFRSKEELICITYVLLTAKRAENLQLYLKFIEMHQSFLEKEGVVFPKDYEQFDYDWIKKSKLHFSSNKTLLDAENVRRYSHRVKEVFGAEKGYFLFSALSEAIHGNPIQYTDSEHNERFWVMAMCISNTAFLIELVDRYTLGKVDARDLRDWLKLISDKKGEFVNLWQQRMRELRSRG